MILVSRTNFDKVTEEISRHKYRGIDTETTGLLAFLGDRMFSGIIATESEEYYFNWNQYPQLPEDLLLEDRHKHLLQERLFNDESAYWFVHKGIFDCAILGVEDMELKGTVHCTVTGERVQYNEHNDYSLEGCGLRRKVPKDMSVENYIKKNKLYSRKDYNGVNIKVPRYDLVPFAMMSKYGCRDAKVCFTIGMDQIKKIEDRSNRVPKGAPKVKDCHANELRLQKTLHGIQMRGARVNGVYCGQAIEHFSEEMSKAQSEFRGISGQDYLQSGKLFKEVFKDELWRCSKTPTGDYSFGGDILESFEHPAAKEVVRYKKAKAKIDFFKNFLKFSDSEGFIHTEFKSYGTRTGRFSSAQPNLQNLEKAKGDDLKKPFVVRRAFIPRNGFFFAMIDYDQVEYRMLLDYAGATKLIDKVLGGLDVHTATAEVSRVSRDEAKTVNFGTVYGQGLDALARSLGVSNSRAKEIQASIFNASPEIKPFLRRVINTAQQRGYIFNWLGRVSYFPKRNFCYKAPNTLLQGGAGDLCKVAMVLADEMLMGYKSNVLLNVHDEIVFEMAYGEEHLLEPIREMMQTIFPHRRLPLTCGIEWSPKSLADKEDFTGVDCVNGKEGRDKIQGTNLSAAEVAT